MLVIPDERHPEHHNDGDDQAAGEQAADEQNTLSATIHHFTMPARLIVRPSEPWLRCSSQA
jgi:hypothetical protein